MAKTCLMEEVDLQNTTPAKIEREYLKNVVSKIYPVSLLRGVKLDDLFTTMEEHWGKKLFIFFSIQFIQNRSFEFSTRLWDVSFGSYLDIVRKEARVFEFNKQTGLFKVG